MQTSRIAQETRKLVKALSPTKSVSRRQTRSFAASISSFAADGSIIKESATKPEYEDEESSLSSAPSDISFDIEDQQSVVPLRKRKRGVDSPSTTITTISTSISTRTSPRKTDIKNEDNGQRKIKKTRRQPAKQSVNEAGEVEIHPPSNWEEIYDSVREMRKKVLAPVDTMGCERLADEDLTPRDKRFQTLIALMLSSQTKDTTNAIAMRALQTSLPHPGLTLENILAVEPEKLNTLIYPVGFHNNKTRYIKAAAIILRDQFDSEIPDTVEGLMSLPGVGPKMAYLCMSAAWGRTEGIGVDVHVHRITNLWGWHKTKGPEETRKMLEGWLPRDKWHEINHLLVGFGQTICLPVGRKCGDCTLAAGALCPSAVIERKKVVKRVRKEEVVVGEEAGGVKVEEEGGVLIKEEEVVAGDTV